MHTAVIQTRSRAHTETMVAACRSTRNHHRYVTSLNSLKSRTEAYQTKLKLKEVEMNYAESLYSIHTLRKQMESDQLLHNIQQSIFKEKNEILTHRLIEYKDKYQQIETKQKYIDNNKSKDAQVAILERTFSNEKLDKIQQSLRDANNIILLKDEKIKALCAENAHLKIRNEELAAKCCELHTMNKEMVESHKEMECIMHSQSVQLTERCSMLKQELDDFQQIWDKQKEYLPNEQLYIHSIPHTPNRSIENMFVTATNAISNDDMKEMEVILEDFEDNELSENDKQYASSQDGLSTDTEDDLVDQLLQNEDFMSSEAVKRLSNISQDDVDQFLCSTIYTDPKRRIRYKSDWRTQYFVNQMQHTKHSKSITELANKQLVAKQIKQWKNIRRKHTVKLKRKRRKKRSKKHRQDNNERIEITTNAIDV